MNIKKVPVQGLCFRCEHRALALEKKGQPRCECGMTNIQVCGCYMYQPCKPVVTVVSPGYKKHPRFAGWMLSARECGVELFGDSLTVKVITKTKSILIWCQKIDAKKKGRKNGGK